MTLAVPVTASGAPPGVADWIRKAAAEINRKLDATSYSAAEILALLLTVDGPGSGLDADLLDSHETSYFIARANHTGTQLASTVSDLATAVGLLNSATATALATSRNINGVAFNGTADITINAVDSTARVPATRAISTTAPLTGGGDLSGDRTLAITAATSGAAGSMSAADKSKLDGVASGATANSSDATLLARANHTGTQAASTISDFTTAAQAVGDPRYGRIIAASGAKVSHTGDTLEFTLATITLPANALGANGWVEIEALVSRAVDNGNNKTFRVKFGGTSYFALTVTTGLSDRLIVKVQNANATNAQVGGPANRKGYENSASAPTTSAVDTASAVTILITGQLGTGTDTLSLESYSVKAFYFA